MATKKRTRSGAGMKILTVFTAIVLLIGCTFAGLELWGSGKLKPSNWGKETVISPVDISVSSTINPLLRTPNGISLCSETSDGLVGEVVVTGTCVLSKGGDDGSEKTYPDYFEWSIEWFGVSTEDNINEYVQIRYSDIGDGVSQCTIQCLQRFPRGTETRLYARAYKDGELRGEGDIFIKAPIFNVALFTLDNRNFGINEEYAYQLRQNNNSVRLEICNMISESDNDVLIEEQRETFNNYFYGDLGTETDCFIFLDYEGEFVSYLQDYVEIASSHAPVLVIDKQKYSDAVEAAGWLYLTDENFEEKFYNGLFSVIEQWANQEEEELSFVYPDPAEIPDTDFLSQFINELQNYGSTHPLEGCFAPEPFGTKTWDIINEIQPNCIVVYNQAFRDPLDLLLASDGSGMQILEKRVKDYYWIILDQFGWEEEFAKELVEYSKYADTEKVILMDFSLQADNLFKYIIPYYLSGNLDYYDIIYQMPPFAFHYKTSYDLCPELFDE